MGALEIRTHLDQDPESNMMAPNLSELRVVGAPQWVLVWLGGVEAGGWQGSSYGAWIVTITPTSNSTKVDFRLAIIFKPHMICSQLNAAHLN
ncbi:hypothetical protein AG1IA_03069 [Rhizoctonia solani AG-1 IA]|uniref:Uncharacterized protein n=1 Tax=Thanatephorus cucumeris (strain AG1-IA) TaxID=983506 RepID=L8WY32_THACA|nr:hypothetical protein AG1IA_03069 [Rhizoctonia solani AG-1 IA]